VYTVSSFITSYNTTIRSWLYSSIAQKINYYISNLYIHYDTKSNVPNPITKYRAAIVVHKGRHAKRVTSRTGRRVRRMRPVWRIIADEQPVRAVGQREVCGQRSNTYKTKFNKKNEARGATHTRCRSVTRMTADKECLRDVSH